MNIILIAIGSIKNQNLIKLIDDYLLRIKKFAKIKLIILKDENDKNLIKAKIFETNKIIEEINKYKTYKKILLDLNSNLVDSIDFTNILVQNKNYDGGKIIFIIGGSNGVDLKLIDKLINLKISFGKITFPHQMFRLILIEQIYRSIKIMRNETYHK